MDYQETQAPEQPGTENETGGQGQPQFRSFQEANPVKPVKTRRVGTFTLGVALIMTGVLLLANMFVPEFPILLLAKLSPAILVLVGLEILVYTLFHKGEKIRYDFLSMVVCLFLIFGSIGLSIIPSFAKHYMAVDELELRASQEIERDVYDALQGEGIYDAYINFYLYESSYSLAEPVDTTVPYSEITGGNLDVNITLGGDFASAEEFATKVRGTLDKLEPLSLPEPYYYFQDKDGEYSLNLRGLWETAYPVEHLEEMVRS